MIYKISKANLNEGEKKLNVKYTTDSRRWRIDTRMPLVFSKVEMKFIIAKIIHGEIKIGLE